MVVFYNIIEKGNKMTLCYYCNLRFNVERLAYYNCTKCSQPCCGHFHRIKGEYHEVGLCFPCQIKLGYYK